MYWVYTSEKDNRLEQSNERGEVDTERIVSISGNADDGAWGADEGVCVVKSCVSTGWISTEVLGFISDEEEEEGFEENGSSSSDILGTEPDGDDVGVDVLSLCS